MKSRTLFFLTLTFLCAVCALVSADPVHIVEGPNSVKIGRQTTDRIGFYGTTPIARPAITVTASTLGGTLTGTTDGTIANVAAIALSTSNTYTDAAVNSAVNTAITSVNLQLKELQTTLNAVIADNTSLRSALEDLGIVSGP